MARKRVWMAVSAAGAAALIAAGAALAVSAGGNDDLAAVKSAVAKYHRTGAAEAAGWNLVPGLDHCFSNPGVGAMGYHYIDAGRLDAELDPEAPEALVYEPGPADQRKLAAVEWIVPAEAWAAAGTSEPPMVLGRPLHLNEALGVYVLHAWAFKKNPTGTYEDWNPTVSCPES